MSCQEFPDSVSSYNIYLSCVKRSFTPIEVNTRLIVNSRIVLSCILHCMSARIYGT